MKTTIEQKLGNRPQLVVVAWILTIALLLSSIGILGSERTFATEETYPWTPTTATGNYINDAYTGITANDHVLESVTQERLLDILSSPGKYYILFGGPKRTSTQKVISAVNSQAKADGITKIYHFDPLVDGYQADITKADTPYKTSQSIHQLWTRITALLPDAAPISTYNSQDTLLFLFQRTGTEERGTITASYTFPQSGVAGYNEATEKAKILNVYRGLSPEVSSNPSAAKISASVRTDRAFFNRVYNASATKIEGSTPSANRIGAPVTLFDGLTDTNFKLHQINFAELQNLYNTPGEHIIFYGASWCHNTQAIIGSVAATAAANNNVSKVYVYDTTLGNQVAFGTGAEINTATGTSSTFNSRNNLNTTNGNHNVSYIYGEAVKPLKNFITENNTYRSNRIHYYPNGNVPTDGNWATGATTADPWAESADPKGAIRLQLPFLIAYDKSKTEPVVRQWLHKQQNQVDGRDVYLEYMLELSWVRATDLAKADTAVYSNGQPSDTNQTKVQIAAEAVQNVKNLFDAAPAITTPGKTKPPTVKGPTAKPSKSVISKVKVGKKSLKVTWKSPAKAKQVTKFQIRYKVKGKKKWVTKTITKASQRTYTIKKLKKGKKYYVSVRAYNAKGWGAWSKNKISGKVK